MRAIPRSSLWLPCLLCLPALQAEVRFVDVTQEWGLDFRHHHGGSGQRYLIETMAGGVVLFDFDGDGDDDVFFVDGSPLPGYQGPPPRSRLYRNEGGGRFVDVIDRSRIEIEAYGGGGTAGDVDNDGDQDLYISSLGPNQLLRNNGDGTFSDISDQAGVADSGFGASAAFADPDRDGDLDLYLANYVEFTPATHRPCIQQELEVYCFPRNYKPQPDRYFRNLGDGTFEEALTEVGLAGLETSAGLGVAFGDLDNDNWIDLYVGNDSYSNSLFRNRGDGTFADESLISGTAYSAFGAPEAGMGVDLGDVDGDGLLDIVVTNFELETNALYKNLGSGLFADSRFTMNIAEPSLLNLAFGVVFADVDQDGDLDLVVANGHIHDNAQVLNEGGRYAQRNQLFLNNGQGRFEEAERAGMEAIRVSRGLARADLDGDGDQDLVFNNSNDVAEVYENTGKTGNWLQVDLDRNDPNSLGIGARVEVESDGRVQIRERRTGSSYLSQSSLTLHFGLAGSSRADKLTVTWPEGHRQSIRGVPANKRIRIGD